MAGETRAKAVSIAGQFGYAQDDAEDIAQDVMLKLWSLHEQLNDKAHLMASAVITTKRVCIDRWRTTHQHADIADLSSFCTSQSLRRATNGFKGFAAAFSAKGTSSDRLISTIQARAEYVELLKYEEIILVAVNI